MVYEKVLSVFEKESITLKFESFFLFKESSATLGLEHRRRMETESKAKCRRFGMGGKIECRTGNFWCECVANVYIAVVQFPFTFVGGWEVGWKLYVDLYFKFLYRFNYH